MTEIGLFDIMKKAKTADAKDNLSVSIDERLARLVRDGIVRPARAAVPKALLGTKPRRAKQGASALRALLDERREGR